MTPDEVYSLKEGDWFTINHTIYKIKDISWRGAFLDAYEMTYDNGEYTEGDIKVFLVKFIKSAGEVYTPYEEEID